MHFVIQEGFQCVPEHYIFMEVLLHRKPAYTKDLGFVSPAVELSCCIEELGNIDLLLLRRPQTF